MMQRPSAPGAGVSQPQQDRRAPFLAGTRRLSLPGEAFDRAGTSPNAQLWQVKESGYLAAMVFNIQGQIASITNPITTGMYSIVKAIEVVHNSLDMLHRFSGEGFALGIRPHLQFYADPMPSATLPDTPLAAGKFNITIRVPFAYTERNLIGLIALDSKSVRLGLRFVFRTDAELAPTGVVTWTTQPHVKTQYILYTAPDPRQYRPPNLDTIHKWIEEVEPISANGPDYYLWPDGNLTLGMYHLVGAADKNNAKDSWTDAQLLINRRQRHMQFDPDTASDENDVARQAIRKLGVIPFDLAAYSGMANMVGAREAIDQDAVNRVESLITYTNAPLTALHIRRVFARVAQVQL